MKLAEFLDTQSEAILAEWERFALSLGTVTRHMDVERLRDHARNMLQAIALDIRTEQSDSERSGKSMGRALGPERQSSAASSHGTGRHLDGFSLPQVVSEFRALRASVLHLWFASTGEPGPNDREQIMRFNEAIDQAIAESVERFSANTDRARDVFLAMLGHDLRSPLQAISMTASTFERHDPDPERGRVAAGRIRRSVASMSAMVNDLLEFSRLQLGGPIPVVRVPSDFVLVCRRAVDDARAARPSCDIRYAGPDGIAGESDGNRLTQMLSNLLDNACQYATRGTSVTLSVREDGEHVVIDVHNVGRVIPPESLRTIFNPLVQLDVDDVDDAATGRPRTSVGLGLHIALQVAEAHGGHITARSSAAAGTTFSVRLPRRSAGRDSRTG